jgi:DNA-binding MarR family transcriptional regulator
MQDDTSKNGERAAGNHPGVTDLTSVRAAIRLQTVSPDADEDRKNHLRLRAWRSTLRRFLRASKEILKEHGMTTLQYQSMLEVWGAADEQGPTIGALAHMIRVRHNTAVAVVNALCKKGLARRERSVSDRRNVHLQLTLQGRTELTNVVREHVLELEKVSTDLRAALG